MSVIRLTVDGQKLIPVEKPLIASQGVVEDSVVFDFSSEWDGYGKVALFWRAEDETRENIYEVMVDENSTALVPWEVTQTDGEICITVFGTQGTSVITAEIIKYKVVEGLYTEGQGSEPPTPDIYQQILAIAGEVNGKFETAIDDIAVIDARVDNITAQQTSGMLSNVKIEVYEATHTLDSTGEAVLVVSPTNAPVLNEAGVYVLDVQGVMTQGNYTNCDHSDGYWFFTSGSDNLTVHFEKSAWANKSTTIRVIFAVPFTQDLSELTDIRVGVDSTTYTSAGAAVRAQINHLQDEIDELGS